MIPAAMLLSIFLLSNMPSPIYPLWQNEIGFPTATITVLFSLYQAGVLIGLLGLGRFSDKIGWRASLIGGTAVSFIAAISFASAETPTMLMIARFMSGIAAGIFVSCGPAAVTAILEQENHQKPALVGSLAISIGLAFGPLIGGLFADYLPKPTHYVFVFEAVLLLVGALALLNDPKLKAAASFKQSSHHTQNHTDDQTESQLQKKLFVVVTIIFASCYITSAIYMSVGPSYLQHTLGLNSALLAGLLVFLVFGSAFTAQMLASKLSPLTQTVIALTVGGTGAILLVIGTSINSPTAFFISAILSGASQGLGQLVGLTLVRKITPLPKLRRAYAILNTVGYGAGGGSIAASWPLFNSLGTITAMVVIATVVVVLTLFAASLTLKFRHSMV
ncbi:MFS transporter [Vibrio sp.]|nr:MFS transporter [Vibrio sp.]